jgi:hypothetical protein
MEKGLSDRIACAELEALASDKVRESATDLNNISPKFCGCAELVVNGKRLPIMRYHDCEYVLARNKLIPFATRLANRRLTLTNEDNSTSANIKFTRLFSLAMDELSARLLTQTNGASPVTAEQMVPSPPDNDLGDQVHKPREVMTVPLM